MWKGLSGGANFFDEKKPRSNRVHVDAGDAANVLAEALLDYIPSERAAGRDLVILGIGTDRSTGDCLGPLIGTKLQSTLPPGVHAYGTLDDPVHAANLTEKLQEIGVRHFEPLVIAVDACLGRSESVGYMSVKKGPLKPGTGVNKKLPSVGDVHLIGVVNVGGFMEYFVLQNTRLSLVMRMADTIVDAVSTYVSHAWIRPGRSASTLP